MNHTYKTFLKAATTIVLIIAVFALFFALNGNNYKAKMATKDKQTPPDTFHIGRNLFIADSLKDIDYDTAFYFYNKALENIKTTEKFNTCSDSLLATTQLGIGYIHCLKGNFFEAQQADSMALVLAEKLNSPYLRSRATMAIGNINLNKGALQNALVLFTIADSLALLANSQVLRAKAASNMAIVSFYMGDQPKAIEGFSQTYRFAVQSGNKPVLGGCLLNIGGFYLNIGLYDSAMTYYKRAVPVFEALNENSSLVLSYLGIGNVYYFKCQYPDAIEAYHQSLKLATEINDKPVMAKTCRTLSDTYKYLGDFENAIAYGFKSIEINESIGNQMALSMSLISLADIYFKKNMYSKALEYYRKALIQNKQIGYKKNQAICASNMGNAFSEMHQPDSCMHYYNVALAIYEKLDAPDNYANLLANIGDEYKKRGQFTEAIPLLNKAIEIARQYDHQFNYGSFHGILADTYIAMADKQPMHKNELLQKALHAALIAHKTVAALNEMEQIKQTASILKKIYVLSGDYKNAFKYGQIAQSYTDSLTAKAGDEALANAEARWQAEKKQLVINKLRDEQTLHEEIILRKEAENRRKTQLIWSAFVLLALTLSGGTFVVLYMRKRRAMEYQKQLSEIVSLRLKNTRNTMSPHFLFNVLSSLGSLGNQPDQLRERIRNLSLLLRKVIENIELTAIPIKDELDAVTAYIQLFANVFDDKFNFEVIADENVSTERLIPSMLLQIPVENALKHGLMPLEGEKLLTITIGETSECLTIEIADNGIGMEAAKGRSIGTGNGLKVLLQTIHILDANNKNKIKFTTAPHLSVPKNPGTLVTITIPNEYDFPTL